MRKIDSQNVVKLYGVYETSNSVYLVQEYAQGINLVKMLKRLPQVPLHHRKNIIRGLLKALKVLEEANILHRDLKPENVIYHGTEESLKIVDFGLATHVNLPSYIYVRCGTPGHVAPEIVSLKSSEPAQFYTVSDVFSVGTIFYELIFKKPLFKGSDQANLLAKNGLCNL